MIFGSGVKAKHALLPALSQKLSHAAYHDSTYCCSSIHTDDDTNLRINKILHVITDIGRILGLHWRL